MLLIDDESYYLTIGRDAPSIIECLSVGEKVAGWIKDCELQSISMKNVYQLFHPV